ncbi:DUF1513 domain-containing protein [Azorhizobium sp. AG788]|uniref:DUF1513 domain-containing protein n=1 Tax=Azorhizobium sp. AG788 TaxID=2183897 RepID=UPI00313A4BDB
MPITRRSLLTATGAALLLPRQGFAAVHALDEGWLTTARVGDGFAALSVGGELSATPRVPSPARLHGIVASPRGPLAVAVGRRPGHVALVFDRDKGGQVGEFAPGAGRVFSGHGRFSPDGTVFLTNEIERGVDEGAKRAMGRGMLAARSVAGDFAIAAEWPTGGDGPHDLMRAGPVLVIANGGIEPNTPEARDADVTGSTITLLDPATGALRGEGVLSADLASLSLRHLASDDRGTVVAAQDLLKDGVARPLLFAIAANGALTPFDAPENELRALRGYVGSVALDRSGAFVACATPRGGRVAVWQRDGHYVGAVPLVDGCGLAGTRTPGQFIATSGYGEVILLAATAEGLGVVARRTGGPQFDNHVVQV